MMPYDNIRNHGCTSCSEERVFPLKEKRSQFRLDNPDLKTVCITEIDGCYITDGIRCDYLVVDCSRPAAYFVELKGSDFFHAIDQIDATINCLQADLNGFSIFARIVVTKIRVPDIGNDPKVLKLQKKLRQRCGDLKYKAILLTETI
jgi:hypothetical protein